MIRRMILWFLCWLLGIRVKHHHHGTGWIPVSMTGKTI
jgi:hypothetical protein